MSDTVLANAMLVLPGEVLQGALTLSQGRIAAITPGAAVPAGAVDCAGDLVLPGLIELHTDNLERHIRPRPKVDWPHDAAILAHDAELAGVGITTVFDALRVGSLPTRSKGDYGEYARGMADEILSLRGRGALRISHLLHLRAELCSETLIEEMAAFGPADAIGIVSLMDHTPGARQFRDTTQLRNYLMGKYGFNQAEFDAHIIDRQMLGAEVGALHETTAVAEARRYGAVLASHDDTEAAHVAQSARNGVHFAEFPTTVEAAEACRAHGIAVMMGAPNLIRGGSHSGNVAAAELAGLGLLDILSSDYVPSALLTAALRLGDLWGDLARGVATVTQAPAAATGLDDRGRLQIGARADVIRARRIGDATRVCGTWVAGERVA